MEVSIFEFLLIGQISETFKNLFDCNTSDALNNYARGIFSRSFSSLDRVKDSLYNKNLIKNRHGDIEVNEDILKVFENPNCNSLAKVANVLLGTAEEATLTKLDFKHIEQKQKKVIKILKSAVKKKQKGVNILLYGNVGVGKTEFAKLVANLAKIPIYSVKTEGKEFKEARREERLIDLKAKQNILSHSKKSCILFDEAEDVMNRGFSCFGSASKGYMNNLL